MAAAKIRVRVFERNGDFFVDPPTVYLSGTDGDRLKIFNTTAEDLVFQIDSDDPFGNVPEKTIVIKSTKSQKFTATAPAAADGKEYPYRILMLKSGKKAIGNSDPSIIIDN